MAAPRKKFKKITCAYRLSPATRELVKLSAARAGESEAWFVEECIQRFYSPVLEEREARIEHLEALLRRLKQHAKTRAHSKGVNSRKEPG